MIRAVMLWHRIKEPAIAAMGLTICVNNMLTTCQLPVYLSTPEWLPQEEALMFCARMPEVLHQDLEEVRAR